MFVRFQIDHLLEPDDLCRMESEAITVLWACSAFKAVAARADVRRPFSCAAAPLLWDSNDLQLILKLRLSYPTNELDSA